MLFLLLLKPLHHHVRQDALKAFHVRRPSETTCRIKLLLVRAYWSPVMMKTVSTPPTARFARASWNS